MTNPKPIRAFYTRAETAGKMFLFDAQQLKTARRKRDQDTKHLLERFKPVVACKLPNGEVIEAENGEFLHAQIRLRIKDNEELDRAIRDLALSVAIEDGFTLEIEADKVDGYFWISYRAKVRSTLRHEYGIYRVPNDLYREQFFIGNSVQEAAKQIAIKY